MDRIRWPANRDSVMPFRKIVFPIDFSKATVSMVPYVAEMARQLNAKVTVLNAFNVVTDYPLAPSLKSSAGPRL